MNIVAPGETTLVLAAHPDDEIGCGGFIRRLTDGGHRVHYAYFSNCAESTRALGFPVEQLIEECHKSCQTLGIRAEDIIDFDLPVRRFPAVRQDLLEALVKLRNKLKPKLVMVASSDDIHQDHQTLTQEAMRAFKYSSIIGYEFPWNQMVSHQDLLVTLTAEQVEAKCKSWSCYATQTSRSYSGSEIFRSLARVRGLQANVEFAESYQILRMIV